METKHKTTKWDCGCYTRTSNYKNGLLIEDFCYYCDEHWLGSHTAHYDECGYGYHYSITEERKKAKAKKKRKVIKAIIPKRRYYAWEYMDGENTTSDTGIAGTLYVFYSKKERDKWTQEGLKRTAIKRNEVRGYFYRMKYQDFKEMMDCCYGVKF